MKEKRERILLWKKTNGEKKIRELNQRKKGSVSAQRGPTGTLIKEVLGLNLEMGNKIREIRLWGEVVMG